MGAAFPSAAGPALWPRRRLRSQPEVTLFRGRDRQTPSLLRGLHLPLGLLLPGAGRSRKPAPSQLYPPRRAPRFAVGAGAAEDSRPGSRDTRPRLVGGGAQSGRCCSCRRLSPPASGFLGHPSWGLGSRASACERRLPRGRQRGAADSPPLGYPALCEAASQACPGGPHVLFTVWPLQSPRGSRGGTLPAAVATQGRGHTASRLRAARGGGSGGKSASGAGALPSPPPALLARRPGNR